MNKYQRDYVDECQSRGKRQLAAYMGLMAATSQTKDPNEVRVLCKSMLENKGSG